MKTNQPRGDITYYYGIHVRKQKAQGLNPVSYSTFRKRLANGMNLHDAIYFPRVEWQVREQKKNPIQDNIRRTAKLREQNIQILDLDELVKVEAKYEEKKENRFISFFKRWTKK